MRSKDGHFESASWATRSPVVSTLSLVGPVKAQHSPPSLSLAEEASSPSCREATRRMCLYTFIFVAFSSCPHSGGEQTRRVRRRGNGGGGTSLGEGLASYELAKGWWFLSLLSGGCWARKQREPQFGVPQAPAVKRWLQGFSHSWE